MTEERADKIYSILKEFGGAQEDDRQDFIYHHCKAEYKSTEYRFRGKFGFGGKYRSSWNGITYYSESVTSELDVLNR